MRTRPTGTRPNDESGTILDGFNRARICQELGLPVAPVMVRHGLSEDEKFQHALTLNLARRHLGAEQRRELVLAIKTARGWSNPHIAEALGVDETTVREDIKTATSGDPKVELPSQTVGRDGKKRRASRTSGPKTVFASTETQAAQVAGDLQVVNQSEQSDISGFSGLQTAQEVSDEARRVLASQKLEQQRKEIKQRCATLSTGNSNEPPFFC